MCRVSRADARVGKRISADVVDDAVVLAAERDRSELAAAYADESLPAELCAALAEAAVIQFETILELEDCL
jgi:hypothetical protein